MASAIDLSLHYLHSEEALQSLDRNLYWPKWNSPWWHMALLFEMGEATRIPREVVSKMVEKLNEMPQTIFPVRGEGSSSEPYACHCMVGNMFQILWACGVDVDEAVPWMRPYLLKYQMSDGGLSCDHEAYSIVGECPSSMVGTIAVFEAVLLCLSRPHTAEEREFLDKSAAFLMGRHLSQGSQTKFNSEEVESAKLWGELTFPRFYFYDTLRGLSALLLWAEIFRQPIPFSAIEDAVSELTQKFSSGNITVGRKGYAGRTTRYITDDGKWERADASMFPLLEEVSQIGSPCITLSKQWFEAKDRIEKLRAASLIL